jgi:hypothetical protein
VGKKAKAYTLLYQGYQIKKIYIEVTFYYFDYFEYQIINTASVQQYPQYPLPPLPPSSLCNHEACPKNN